MWWEHLAKTAKKHGVNEILVETNFMRLEIYQTVLEAKPTPGECGMSAGARHANQQKELRIIDTMAGSCRPTVLLWIVG